MTTTATKMTEAEIQEALDFWAEYQSKHDVSGLHGQTVGIDPAGRRVWFGERALDVARAARADGVTAPLLAIRVGYDYYQRKGGRR